jgi:centrosomal protein CEP104
MQSEEHEPECDGWVSQRFCVYPQDIVFQFGGTVKISQLSFLIHEVKIPKNVELYGYAPPASGENLMAGNVNYKKIGHFSIGDNSQTNYSARELKTVYVNSTVKYLKLVFSKNHSCGKNIFN